MRALSEICCRRACEDRLFSPETYKSRYILQEQDAGSGTGCVRQET